MTTLREELSIHLHNIETLCDELRSILRLAPAGLDMHRLTYNIAKLAESLQYRVEDAALHAGLSTT